MSILHFMPEPYRYDGPIPAFDPAHARHWDQRGLGYCLKAMQRQTQTSLCTRRQALSTSKILADPRLGLLSKRLKQLRLWQQQAR